MTAVEAETPAPPHETDADEVAGAGAARRALGERALARSSIPIAMLVLAGRRLAGLRHRRRGAALHPAEPAPHRRRRSSPTGRSSAGAPRSRCSTTFLALAIALVGGVALAILMAQSRWIELALFPYAVILQVTPIVAIAPLILIYTEHDAAGAADLRLARRLLPGALQHHAGPAQSTDHNLLNLFELYGASRWQTLIHLRLPNALPYFLAGPADRRRPRADRRGRRRVRRRHRRRRLRPRLPPDRSAAPAQHPAPLRGAGAPLADRRR